MVCSFIRFFGVNSHSKMCLESKYFQERRVSASNHYESAKLEHIYTQLCRESTAGVMSIKMLWLHSYQILIQLNIYGRFRKNDVHSSSWLPETFMRVSGSPNKLLIHCMLIFPLICYLAVAIKTSWTNLEHVNERMLWPPGRCRPANKESMQLMCEAVLIHVLQPC